MELHTLSHDHIHAANPPSTTTTTTPPPQTPTASPTAPAQTPPPPSASPKPDGTTTTTTQSPNPLIPRIRKWWSSEISVVVIIQRSVPTSRSSRPHSPSSSSAVDQPDPNPNPNPNPKNNTPDSNSKAQAQTQAQAQAEEPICDPRDFLALERTFLAYLRTSMALVLFGVMVTQLFVLKKVDRAPGVALGSVCAAGGIVVALVGGIRYFGQQKLLVQGKTVAAGWDLMALLGVLGSVLLAVLVVVLVQ